MRTLSESPPGIRPIRAFMAAAVSEAVRGKLVEIQARLKRTGADIACVAPANIHLTLVFLGAIFETQASELSAATDAIAEGYRHCTLEVTGIGSFGRPRLPKVIWAGLAGNLQSLLDLQSSIVSAANRKGIYADNKPFHPHLTLGRVRSPRNMADLLAALETCRSADFGSIAIDRVLLMKSELSAAGPVYTTLHESRMAGK